MPYRIMMRIAAKYLSIDSISLPTGDINPGWSANLKYAKEFDSLESAQETLGHIESHYGPYVVDGEGKAVDHA